jgi:hypothetical protein
MIHDAYDENLLLRVWLLWVWLLRVWLWLLLLRVWVWVWLWLRLRLRLLLLYCGYHHRNNGGNKLGKFLLRERHLKVVKYTNKPALEL